MRKFFCRNLCALLMACLFVTGMFSPVSRFLPSTIRQAFDPKVAFAWTFGLDTLISLLAGLGAVGLVIVVLTALGGIAAGGTILSILATIGGPFGAIGGIIGMAGIAILVKGLADEGIDYILIRMAQIWKSEGKILSQIEQEIDDLPAVLINDSRKEEVKRSIRPYMK